MYIPSPEVFQSIPNVCAPVCVPIRGRLCLFLLLLVRAIFITGGAHSGSCLWRLFWRTFWIVPAALVFFGRCCCPCEVVAAHAPLSQIAAREDNRLYFDQEWGKDLTDSLIMQHKQRIREGVNPTGGSARNSTEFVATVQKREE